jgi:hypothetical protein
LNYYVFSDGEIPETKWGGESFVSKVDEIKDRLDELLELYQEKLMTFEEIGKETGIAWWTIKELFEKKGIERISLSERARLKREKDFDTLHRLHFEEKIGITELYRKHGFSSPYVRAVLADKGIKTVKWHVNQYR